VEISGECGGQWFLSRENGKWELLKEPAAELGARVTIPQEIAWRIFTKGSIVIQPEHKLRLKAIRIWPTAFSISPPSSLSSPSQELTRIHTDKSRFKSV
jgi:hypothetical protein